jgi:hypothetical protein
VSSLRRACHAELVLEEGGIRRLERWSKTKLGDCCCRASRSPVLELRQTGEGLLHEADEHVVMDLEAGVLLVGLDAVENLAGKLFVVQPGLVEVDYLATALNTSSVPGSFLSPLWLLSKRPTAC